MQPLEKEILQLIRLEQLIRSGEKIIIGVSGGPDSMALLHVLVRLASELDFTPAAVYVNHGLRPVEAEAEKNLVEAAAGRLAIEFFAGSVEVRETAAGKKLSVEHAARLLRYDFLERIADRWGATKIAVAHTADDQAEEILIRLVRGTARKGLSGMRTMRNGSIIRPLLRTPKTRLLAYLKQNSIEFLHDSSNDDNQFLRNRIRNDLLPHLEDHYNPDIRHTLIRTANILQDEENFLEKVTDIAFTEAISTVATTSEQLKADDPGFGWQLIVDINRFASLNRAVQRRVLEKCCWLMECEPGSRQIEDILKLAGKNTAGSSLHLPDGLRVNRESSGLRFSYPQGKGPFRGNISDDKETTFPETVIPGPGTYELPALGKRLVVEQIGKPDPGAGIDFSTGEFLDVALFSFPLTLRGPETGDRFHPLGAPGSRKVSDFLCDRKVGRSLRPLIPLLCTDDTILAMPGLISAGVVVGAQLGARLSSRIRGRYIEWGLAIALLALAARLLAAP